MSTKPLVAAAAFLLGDCTYAETPHGCMAVVDLPTRPETIINKNVTVSVPPSMAAIYQDSMPVGYLRPHPHRYYGY